jgi:hypothetical protein
MEPNAEDDVTDSEANNLQSRSSSPDLPEQIATDEYVSEYVEATEGMTLAPAAVKVDRKKKKGRKTVRKNRSSIEPGVNDGGFGS